MDPFRFTELHLSQDEWDAIDLWMEQLDYDEDNAEDRLKKPFASLLWHEDMVPLIRRAIDADLWKDATTNGPIEHSSFQSLAEHSEEESKTSDHSEPYQETEFPVQGKPRSG